MRRALFIGGSLNQTKQMHAVARELREWKASFSPFFGDRTVETLRRLGLTETTICGDKLRKRCLDYLHDHRLEVDMHGSRGDYDLVVSCTDLVVPRIARRGPLVVVQEGILDPPGFMSHLCQRFPRLPRWLSGTTLTGTSGIYDRFCVASEGYKRHFVAMGADPSRIRVTGIPNFDDCQRFHDNDFPLHDYVLVCTSDTRETFKRDDRRELVKRAVRIAAGRTLLFKLHPNENARRSTAEIRKWAPNAHVYASGNTEAMIANCSVLITQWSSTAFVGLALGKEVHSNHDSAELRELAPLQNGGNSAKRIAQVCRELTRRTRVVHLRTILWGRPSRGVA
ncbi:hypothetical protein LVJ94_25470 [Pendulispora rubella]|uniref:UDP-N-acetyl glucosamine 2-epimerase n=1 Tax=Pendulispora rubella TaxID=2741070 RepID=A0ABZ2LHY9_9BACT